MGTRGLLGIIYKGTRRAAYNHWDSYPTGMGRDVVDFLLTLDEDKLKIMLERLDKLEWVDGDDTVPDADLEHYESLIKKDRDREDGMWQYNDWMEAKERYGEAWMTTRAE